jgi:predicted negative regulator of RcsB-dependent stress response
LAQEAKDRRLEAEAIYHLGLAKMRRPDFAAAVAELKTASRLARAAADTYRQCLCQLALATAQAEVGRAASARQYLRQGSSKIEELSSYNLEPYYDYVAARVALAGDDAGEACRLFAAAATAKRSPEPFLTLRARLRQAAACAVAGRLKRAERAIEAAGELLAKAPGRRFAGLCQYVKGLLAARQGERAKATRRFKKAIDILAATDTLAAAHARADFGAHLASVGEASRAQPLLAAAARYFESLGNKKKADRLRAPVKIKKVRRGRKSSAR